jgi:hypothetical protein
MTRSGCPERKNFVLYGKQKRAAPKRLGPTAKPGKLGYGRERLLGDSPHDVIIIIKLPN